MSSAARSDGICRLLSRPGWRPRVACFQNEIPPGRRGPIGRKSPRPRAVFHGVVRCRLTAVREWPKRSAKWWPRPSSSRPPIPASGPSPSSASRSPRTSGRRPSTSRSWEPKPSRARPPRAQARGRLLPVPGRGSAADPVHAGPHLQARRQRQEVRRDQPPDRRGHRLRSQGRPITRRRPRHEPEEDDDDHRAKTPTRARLTGHSP